ncbi:MAG: hypothetical protein QOD77_1857 [Thermoplasmata archaeon]|jgi:hypothetical protein|nr:hypothetical protein [Thermoplasmata archaeon]
MVEDAAGGWAGVKPRRWHASIAAAVLLAPLAGLPLAALPAHAAGVHEWPHDDVLPDNFFEYFYYNATEGIERFDLTLVSDVPIDVLLLTAGQFADFSAGASVPWVDGHLNVRSLDARFTMLPAGDYVLVLDNSDFPSAGVRAHANATLAFTLTDLFTPGFASSPDDLRAAVLRQAPFYELPGLIGYAVSGITIVLAAAALALAWPAGRSRAPFLRPLLGVAAVAGAYTLGAWLLAPSAYPDTRPLLLAAFAAGAWTGNRSQGLGAALAAMLAAFLGILLGSDAVSALLRAPIQADELFLHGSLFVVGGGDWADATNLAPLAALAGWLGGRFLLPASRLRLDLRLDGDLQDGTLTARVRNRWGRPVRDVRLFVAFVGHNQSHSPLLDEPLSPRLRRTVERTVRNPAATLKAGVVPTGLLAAATGGRGRPAVVFVPLDPDQVRPAG